MPTFRARRLVSVPAAVAYDVAADVASYNAFLPLLEESAILHPVREEHGVHTFRARLSVGYAKLKLREKFTSNVCCDSGRRTVTATSQEAPFRDMRTVWTIIDMDGRADVFIEIDYAMRNPLLQAVLGGVMEFAVGKVMTAFEQRALSIYAAASRKS